LAYGAFALGWTGSAKGWHRYRSASIILAGLATPLVVSVHTIVSFDFTIGIIPGWHSTIFPPYFVAGAIYSGFAMVLTLMIPLRSWYGFKDFITGRHLEVMAKVMLTTGLIVAYGYGMEAFMAWYSGNKYEIRSLTQERPFGDYGHTYWQLILCNVVIPQLLWIRWFRTNPYALWLISIVVNIGMWLERYIIVITSLHKDFLPSSADMYHGSRWDYMTYFGSIGLFMTLIFLFIRVLPSISIVEMRELAHEKAAHGSNHISIEDAPDGTH
jgi:molybdopterin-containing oxidoreductase family membrane subunit